MTTGSVVTGVAEIVLSVRSASTHFPEMSARALFFKDPEGNLLELICHDERQKAVDNTRG